MASKSLNKVMLIGNVTRDPELRYTPQGNAVATFGLATNRSWKTDSGEMREEAEFHRLVAWNKLAELCSQLCTKGRKIYVEGRLQTRTFTGSDNVQHTITEIVIEDMLLLDSKGAFAGASAGQFGGGAGAHVAAPTREEVEPGAEPAPVGTAADDQGAKGGKGKKRSGQGGSASGGKEEKTPEETATPGEEKIDVDDIPF